jgi:molybdate transport system substrate-binding protein
VLLNSACGGGGASTADSDATLSGDLTVYAASSLTDAFNDIAAAFHATYPDVDVRFNFAGSPTLRTQIEQGAGADVLATADEPNMRAAFESHLVVDAGEAVAGNTLVIIVPKGNPGHVAMPSDLARDALKLVLAQDGVPAGTYARAAIEKMAADPAFGPSFSARVLANVVSDEPNVKAVVAKVQLGEADAGIVYATDVTPGVVSDVETVAIPGAYNIVVSYPIAVTSEAAHAAVARAFIDYVLSDAGQAILRGYGFLPRS